MHTYAKLVPTGQAMGSQATAHEVKGHWNGHLEGTLLASSMEDHCSLQWRITALSKGGLDIRREEDEVQVKMSQEQESCLNWVSLIRVIFLLGFFVILAHSKRFISLTCFVTSWSSFLLS